MERKDVYVVNKKARQLRSADEFASFRHLEGTAVTMLIGNWRTRAPRRTIFLKDYPKTILIKMEFDFGSYKEMITKAALAVGDVKIQEIKEVWK